MPVYRLSAQIIGRGSGKSAVAAAAYRAAERLVEAVSAVASAAYRSGSALGDGTRSVEHDFVAKRGVVHSEIVLPADAPPWMADRERLWNAVEAAEKRKDAQLAREIQLAIPRELDRRAQTGLVRDFVTEHFVALGMVADFAIHDVRARDGGRQPHSHVMLTLRRIDPESRTGFGLKETAWNRKELLRGWREAWAGHVNAALERSAVAERVDHRTLEAQRQEAAAAGDFAKAAELDREPEPKVGPQAWALERDGIATDRGDMLREVRERNAERRQVYEQVAEHGEAAMARFLALREQAGDAIEAFVAWGEERVAELSAFARGAMVAAGIGAAALGLLPERDSFRPPEATVEVTAPATPREERAVVTGSDDTEIEMLLQEMDRETAHREAATREAVERELPEAEAREAGVTAGDRPAPLSEEEIAAIGREEAELEAEAEGDGQEVDEAEALLAEMEEQDRAAEQEGLEIGD